VPTVLLDRLKPSFSWTPLMDAATQAPSRRHTNGSMTVRYAKPMEYVMPSAKDMMIAMKRNPALRSIGYKIELSLLSIIEGAFDFRYNISTRSDNLKPAFVDDEGYDPITYPGLRYIQDRVKIAPGEVLADVGCGRGRAVCFFSRNPSVARCVGIEYHTGHAEIARHNAEHLRGRIAPISIVEGDAAGHDYGEITMALLFNPFGEATMRRTIRAIYQSLLEHPRPLRLVYVNPKFEHVFQEQPWLVKTDTFLIPNRIHRSLPTSVWHSIDS
jgi:hypothetical protein